MKGKKHKKKIGTEVSFEAIITENFSKLMIDSKLQIMEDIQQ